LSDVKKVVFIALPFLGAVIVILNYYLVPDADDMFRKRLEYPLVIVFIVAFFTVRCIYSRIRGKENFEEYVSKAPRLFVMLLFFTLWDVITAKLQLVSPYYFKDANRIVAAVFDNGGAIILNILYSLRLLFLGYFSGLAAGFITGVFAGWFPKARYWIMPIVKKIGPIPSTVWIPIFVVLIPSLFASSVVLIAFGVWFPTTLMTATGIMGVPSSYIEVAKTLGAKQSYLLFKVALPSALPSLFMGMFMGMNISCVALISAEMLGSKAGLGWFINIATSWGEYGKVYAGVIIILLIFSSVTALLFKINSKLLKWQKDAIQW
jgi:NitT/TauT family transport system permease protein